jgi:glucan 1,3-beta-glucosidase
MQEHWDYWVTEQTLSDLVSMGIEIVRVPIGDWMYDPRDTPFQGCMDGGEQKLEWLFGQADTLGLKVVLDMHALKGSQNGKASSGQTLPITWLQDSVFSHYCAEYSGNYQWETIGGNWQG